MLGLKDKVQLSKPKNLVILFFLFLFFFPIKTQFYNLVLISFDYILTSGKITQIYNYNYLGQLIGCSELNEASISLGNQFSKFNFFVRITHYVIALVSILWFLKRRKIHPKLKIVDWILLLLFCFFVVDALEYFANMIFNLSDVISFFNTTKFSFFVNILWIFIGLYVLFFKLQPSDKLQVFFIVLPATILSFFMWFMYLGPRILPLDMS